MLLASWTTTIKHPSPSTNPTNQFISCISENLTSGLAVGITLGKNSLNLSDSPQFKLAFILTNLSNPSIVRCDLFSIK
ncbi:hypothetical protein GCM10023220_71550 [Streptomyces ziwulingensis]|uniref:Uncharacterized protein n=1 Tax=Streptomyces ziwulingensis TaxID=1045501 RepID=A0ABP9D860_9ACTN